LDDLFVINKNGQFLKANKEFGKDDIIVIPEGFMGLFSVFHNQFKFECKKVLYAQGWSYIVPSMVQSFQGQVPQLDALGVNHVISVSEAVSKYIMDVFKYPKEKISIVQNTIDPNLFNLELGKEDVESVSEKEDGELDIEIKTVPKTRKNIITFMPRRGVDMQYHRAIMLFKSISKHADWEIKPIQNLSSEDVAKSLKESKIFLHYTDGEGFGLPPLEAIMTGNRIVGNVGLGSVEFFVNWYVPWDVKDPYAWVVKIDEAIEAWEKSGEPAVPHEEYANRYSEENRKRQLKEVFTSLQE